MAGSGGHVGTRSLDGAELTDGAWSYPDLRPGAVERVGKDFAGYVAFDRKVVVSD